MKEAYLRAPESMPTSAQTMNRKRGSASMRSRRNGSVRASHPAKNDLCARNRRGIVSKSPK